MAIVLAGSSAYAQSLGDVARANREKQNAEDANAASKPRVITNQDLDSDADQADEEESPTTGKTAARASPAQRAADQRSAHRSSEQRLAQQRAAEQWKRQIVAQKNKVSNLQARIERIRMSIRLANGGVQAAEPFNRYQAGQLQQMALLQEQLGAQRAKLEQMQEAARHAGMHTVVYDP
jgi:predicted RNase H-like nuclease (RuvC/YqgF family)